MVKNAVRKQDKTKPVSEPLAEIGQCVRLIVTTMRKVYPSSLVDELEAAVERRLRRAGTAVGN